MARHSIPADDKFLEAASEIVNLAQDVSKGKFIFLDEAKHDLQSKINALVRAGQQLIVEHKDDAGYYNETIDETLQMLRNNLNNILDTTVGSRQKERLFLDDLINNKLGDTDRAVGIRERMTKKRPKTAPLDPMALPKRGTKQDYWRAIP